ncbi:MAG: FeoB-associated Cys-rich membrane protein [Clostridiales bacterium]|nr:FeoB-associated Cys-rich membrane protein [Clostridiales bacterium]
MSLILSNIANILVFALVVSAIFGSLFYLKRNEKNGIGCGCGGQCGSCPSSGLCNDDKPDIFDEKRGNNR